MSDSISFSYKTTKIGIVASVVVACALASATVILGVNSNQPSDNGLGGIQYPASFEALANGCGDTFRFEPSADYYGVIPQKFHDDEKPNPLIPTHRMMIPVYGYMATDALPEDSIRFYGPDELDESFSKEVALRAMYDHDVTMIWYTSDIEPSDLSAIRNYVEEHPKVMAAQWDYAGGKLVGDRSVAFTKWGISQSCSLFNEGILTDFIVFANQNKVSHSDVAKDVELTENGMLPAIR